MRLLLLLQFNRRIQYSSTLELVLTLTETQIYRRWDSSLVNVWIHYIKIFNVQKLPWFLQPLFSVFHGSVINNSHRSCLFSFQCLPGPLRPVCSDSLPDSYYFTLFLLAPLIPATWFWFDYFLSINTSWIYHLPKSTFYILPQASYLKNTSWISKLLCPQILVKWAFFWSSFLPLRRVKFLQSFSLRGQRKEKNHHLGQIPSANQVWDYAENSRVPWSKELPKYTRFLTVRSNLTILSRSAICVQGHFISPSIFLFDRKNM